MFPFNSIPADVKELPKTPIGAGLFSMVLAWLKASSSTSSNEFSATNLGGVFSLSAFDVGLSLEAISNCSSVGIDKYEVTESSRKMSLWSGSIQEVNSIAVTQSSPVIG
jgi:hypothetical protein